MTTEQKKHAMYYDLACLKGQKKHPKLLARFENHLEEYLEGLRLELQMAREDASGRAGDAKDLQELRESAGRLIVRNTQLEEALRNQAHDIQAWEGNYDQLWNQLQATPEKLTDKNPNTFNGLERIGGIVIDAKNGAYPMKDNDIFHGDNNKLVASIEALLALDAKGALVPHGIGEHARTLLATGLQRLIASNERVDVLERALGGMLFGFDDGVGREWSADLLDFARTLTLAVEFKSDAELIDEGIADADAGRLKPLGDVKARYAAVRPVRFSDLPVTQADLDRVTAERDAALAENKILRHDVSSYLETVAKVCDMLGVELESAKTAEGKPSDVLFGYASSMQQRLTAADERAEVLEGLLREASVELHDFITGSLLDRIDAALKPAEVAQ